MAKKIIISLFLIASLAAAQETTENSTWQLAIDLTLGTSTLFGNFWFAPQKESATISAGLLGVDAGLTLRTPITDTIHATIGQTSTFRAIQAIFTDKDQDYPSTPWSSHIRAGIQIGSFADFSFGLNFGTLIDIGDCFYSGTSVGASIIYKKFMINIDSIYQESPLISVGLEAYLDSILRF